ncbi:Hypothetical protein LUCI_4494 [Lucifera butyrica]|uniref:Malic oxidoreductase n=1 Tax=Lucifera butyrica TaxID=1351585 RepID=A0A498RE48_9FIRM|nr:malic enzyme-like NAD(P)-binding protein [Lucifera butyrica]VBB09207.1 Hypothetical protein LUCI_4494 [Lucifera butyrica]
MELRERALKLHKDNQGKIALQCKVPVANKDDLTLAYTPGVAEPCLEIKADYDKIYDYTAKGNLVAVVTNGTAVLGLGDIGAGAGMPVMEGKAVLFKTFAGVDAFPICLDTKDVDKIVEAVKLMEPTFGGINLEDIKAPECFAVEDRLKEICRIPIFHDDQHGTAVVTLAGLINALKIVNKRFADLKVVLNGAGAAGTAIAKLLQSFGTTDIILCDRKGIISLKNPDLTPDKRKIAERFNPRQLTGKLSDALQGADVFIGVSAPGAVTAEMVATMNRDAILFAMANPVPEIYPEEAKQGGAKVIGTGRSDFPNQVNNVLAFPGIFRGALDVRAATINEAMKIAAAEAIAGCIPAAELNPDYIIPYAFDRNVAPRVAAAVAKAALATGVAQNQDVTPEWVAEHTQKLLTANK